MKSKKLASGKNDNKFWKPNNWKPNPEIEEILNEKGLAWKYVTVPLERIDAAKSEAWNTRGGNVEEKQMQRYVRQMEDGQEFKAVSGYEEDGTIVLSDGRHRIAACKQAGWKQVMVCLHDKSDEREITSIAVLANECHGSPGSEADIFGPAVDEVVNMGMSPADVSRRYNINPTRLAQRVKERRANNKLKSMSVIPTKLSKSLQKTIVQIGESAQMLLPEGDFESVAAELAKASPSKVTTKMVQDWGQKILSGKTQTDQRRRMIEGKKTLLKMLSHPQKRKSQKYMQFTRFCEGMKRLHKTAKSGSDLGLTPEDIAHGRKEGYDTAFLWAAKVFKK